MLSSLDSDRVFLPIFILEQRCADRNAKNLFLTSRFDTIQEERCPLR